MDTTRKIEYGNKLIEDFMNLKNDIEGRISFLYSIGEGFPYTLRICEEKLIEGEVHKEIEDMMPTDFKVETYSFHNSWDWLMPVIIKIRSLYNNREIMHNNFIDVLAEACIEVNIIQAYDAVVEIIKLYKESPCKDTMIQDESLN